MHHSTPLRSSSSIPSPRKPREYPWRLLALYCLVVLGFLAMSGITGDRYWPVQLFGYVRDIALLLALVPLPFVLWSRRRRPVILQLLCAVSLLWLPAGAQNMPREAPAGSIELTVMTYNLGDDLIDPARLIPFLEQSGADIIALQEVAPHTATALETDLAEAYPYQVVLGLGIPGKALLSTFPIIDHQVLDSNPDRPDLLATVDIHGVHSTVIVAHPPPPQVTSSGVKSGPEGDQQFAALIETIAGTSGPTLLMGDLNITQHHDRYGQLRSIGLADAYAETGNGLGYTYPARMPVLDDVSQTLADAPMVPLLRIDYIWGTSQWYPLETRVGDDAGSDHLPVVSRMALVVPTAGMFESGQCAGVFGTVPHDRQRPEPVKECH